MKHLPLAAAVLAFAALSAQAQTIERVKMTDNDLSCQQIYGEIGQMDKVVAMAAQQSAAATPAVAQDPAANVGGQVAGAVAQTALAGAVAQNPGLLGNLGGFGGGLGSMFGGIAQQFAAQQAANAGAAQQQAATTQQSIALQAQQAQGRKEHLTGMFLSKGCKMSDIQK